MVDLYNYTTLDIMGDLAFGESLGQLSSATYSPWVKAIFGFVKIISFSSVCRGWRGLTRLLQIFMPSDVKSQPQIHLKFAKEC
ncbi:hypothetical protein ACN47E_008511 [Coniothyrium glycines]